MLYGSLVIRRKAGMARGERHGIGMGLEPGPAGKSGLAGDQPLGIGKPVVGAGQAKRAQLLAGVVGFVVFQCSQQALGAFAQGRQVEQAVVAGCIDGGHANSFGARSADKPGAGTKM